MSRGREPYSSRMDTRSEAYGPRSEGGRSSPPPNARPAPIPEPVPLSPPPLPPAPCRRSFSFPRSPLPRPPALDGRVGPCMGIARSGGIGSRSSASRMKLRSETTSSCVCTGRPATSSRAARSANRTCSSVPSKIMSDRTASTKSRMRRARSDPRAFSGGWIHRRWGTILGHGLA